jgi:hypothetical protein
VNATLECSSDVLKTSWIWVDYDAAAVAARMHPAMDVMRKSHGMLSRDMFVNALKTGQIQLLLLPDDAAALVSWGLCEEGKALHILTIHTAMENADSTLASIEGAARESAADCVMAVTRHGWKKTAKLHGCEVHDCLFIKKVLT